MPWTLMITWRGTLTTGTLIDFVRFLFCKIPPLSCSLPGSATPIAIINLRISHNTRALKLLMAHGSRANAEV